MDTGEVSERSVTPELYGQFLIDVFNEWVVQDVGDIFVQIFEQCISAWAGYQPGLCVFQETCGLAAVMEHNGDLYVCDHFGCILNISWEIFRRPILVNWFFLINNRNLGKTKKTNYPASVKNVNIIFICHGGCPKKQNKRSGTG